MAIASKYFHHLVEWEVVVCKECQHAVWPDYISGHLSGKQHRVPQKEAVQIQEEVQAWPGVTSARSQFQIPPFITQPIPEVPLFTDGIQCIKDPKRCLYICRGKDVMQKHWRVQHNWSVRRARGRFPIHEKANVQKQFESAAQPVHCQRLFVNQAHSQYFEVRQPEEAAIEQAFPHRGQRAFERIWERSGYRIEECKQRTYEVIQRGDQTETTPWIRRTGWDQYLEGCNRTDLLESIAKPEEIEEKRNSRYERDSDAEEEQLTNQMDIAIWQAISKVAAKSQAVVQDSGVMIRLEAVKSEEGQRRYHPLQPYQEDESIDRRCQPWQQMVLFFVRTQREHNWQSPRYRFNREQAAAFERVIQAAREQVTMGQESEASSEESEEEGSEVEESGGGRVEEGGKEEMGEEEEQGKVSKTPLSMLERACLRFCIALLNQTIHNREYDMAVVCAAAVLGIHPTRGFRDPETYPPIISSILKVARFMIIQHAEDIGRIEERTDGFSPGRSPCQFDKGGDSGYKSSSAVEVVPQDRTVKTSFEWVRQMMNTFAVRGTASPMQWFLDLRTYGLKIHYNTTTIGHVNWKDEYTLEYKKVAFTMDQFRGMVHQLVEETRQALLEDVLFTTDSKELPQIPWKVVHDDPTNQEVGWSFIQDQRSRLPVNGQEWLYERIRNREGLYRRFIREEADSGYSRERVRDWMRQVVRFRGLLLILMHITGGQPARGPEILSVRHRNTAAGGHRNLFIEDGQVVFVTKYHKGIQITGDIKIIHRYLPREVGELVVWYVWLAVPFIERIEALVWSHQQTSDYMWPADPDGKRWTTDRMKGELQSISERGLGQAIHVAAYREIAIAISRKWVRGASAFTTDSEEGGIEAQIEEMDHDAADEQATHSPHIAGMIYARDVLELAGSSADKRRRFRQVSTDWHRFLAFESVQVKKEERLLKRKRGPFEEESEEEHTRRRRRIREMDVLVELRGMMQREVALRSVQAQAFKAIQRGDRHIVAVMPTGAGKSVLFMLPAFVEPRGVTIVVVPLRALRKDMIYRCELLGIKCASWEPHAAADGASIVLVTPERVASEEFATFIRRLNRLQSLDRVIIDECHVILNDQLGFRKQLQQLGQLSIAEVQTVLLTATMPPVQEDELFRRMYWRREEVTLIRGPTVRKNIKYSVIEGKPSKKERDEQLEGFVHEVLEQTTGKAIIMCESKAKVRYIVEAGLFPCEAFHADLPGQEREQILEDFRVGNIRVIVATGAFGMGIDIPDIRLVVHIDEPRNMLDYGQASGRAGRDGFKSHAIIIRGGLTFWDPEVVEYMRPDRRRCRRVNIDRYVDGDQERQECREGEEKCDWCRGVEGIGEGIGSLGYSEGEVNNGVAQAQEIEDRATQAQEIEDRVTQAQEREDRITRTGQTVDRATRTGQRVDRFTRMGETEDRVTRTGQTVDQVTRTGETEDRVTQARGREEQVTRTGETEDRVTGKEPINRLGRAEAPAIYRQQSAEIRRIQVVQDRANEVRAMVRRLEGWKGKCVVCFAAKRDHHHIVSQCPSVEGQAAERERRQAASKGGVRFTKQVVCYRCGVPPEICEKWIERGKQRPGGQCQFYGVLLGVVYGIKHGYPEIWQQWFRRVRQRDVTVVGEQESKVEEWSRFGAVARGRAIECTWLLYAFHEMIGQVEEISRFRGG